MRFRDRRGPLAAVILCCAYAAILLFGVTEIARLVTGTKGAPFPPVLTLLLTCNALLMVRSEEHTSELPSLMRISYAVFCLTKKKYTNVHHPNLVSTTLLK